MMEYRGQRIQITCIGQLIKIYNSVTGICHNIMNKITAYEASPTCYEQCLQLNIASW